MITRTEAIERIKTGNHKHGKGADRQVDTDLLIIRMLENQTVVPILLPDGELCFYSTESDLPGGAKLGGEDGDAVPSGSSDE